MRDKHGQSSPPSAPLPSAPFSHFGAWVAVWSPHLWQNVTISACFTEKKQTWLSVGLDHLELRNHLFQQTSANSWTSRHVSDLWIFVALSSDSSGLTTQLVVFHLNFHCSCANYTSPLIHKTLEPLLQVSPVISCHVLPNRPNRPFGSSRSWHITPASKPEAHTNWPLIVDQWPRPDARFCSLLLHCQSCRKQSPWASCCKGTSTEKPNSRFPRWHWPSTAFSPLKLMFLRFNLITGCPEND